MKMSRVFDAATLVCGLIGGMFETAALSGAAARNEGSIIIPVIGVALAALLIVVGIIRILTAFERKTEITIHMNHPPESGEFGSGAGYGFGAGSNGVARNYMVGSEAPYKWPTDN